eukprot:231395-Amphidinium_carterae.1
MSHAYKSSLRFTLRMLACQWLGYFCCGAAAGTGGPNRCHFRHRISPKRSMIREEADFEESTELVWSQPDAVLSPNSHSRATSQLHVAHQRSWGVGFLSPMSEEDQP